MPKIIVSKSDIEKLVGKNIDEDRLIELMFLYLKADADKIEGDEITVKIEDTNRPDLWSAEGLARSLRNILGREVGIKEYKVEDSKIVVNVDDLSLKNIRPFIACAVVKGVRLDSNLIKSFMQMQDKLDTNYGRKRKKTSIGFYDLDKIKPPILYTTVEPDSVKFIPLGCSESMTPREILEKHPKGVEYGHLLNEAKEYPILIDSENQILSFPPIINSNELGNINENTKNLMIEVTGNDYPAVLNVLGIICAALVERGGKIYYTKIKYKNKNIEEVTPKLEPLKFEIQPSYVRQRIGIDLDIREISKILEKMGYETLESDIKNDKITLLAPFYRRDIMHPVDIVEDVAIGYGYNNIEPAEVKVPTIGGLEPLTNKENLIREVMIGIGYQEVHSFMLTNKEILFKKMGLAEKPVIEIANPISENWNCLRDSLIPIIINFLSANKTVEFPQKVFELGPVVFLDEKMENYTGQSNILCAAITHNTANFTEIKSVLDKMMNDLNKEYFIEPSDSSEFIPGRHAFIKRGKKTIGRIGEIHPQVLENFGLENPVAIFEICIDEL